ncbi:carbon-nitrogen hydrolase family protein [Undibacterium umbellatum]|uniref:Carbon-nitrogen hydrolase family protein n=1 Tax=Undibacterium umbellatum TaxID=2762300 RepID=A0ABR6Z8G7_9BURK|nr:carbon-nitrogen hydrolase family protein [Undibacterium umbellatum]MBC3908068.1 carbon-nitrogen hydrolase family protein [Undibacterium umbellatum]
MNKNKLRIAAFQRHPVFDDLQKTTARLQEDLRWCRDHGVELAIFPESYLLGYASDAPTIALRALSINSPAFQQMLSDLSVFETDIMIGFFEQGAAGIYNSAAVIRRGRLLGTYAKQHPNERGVLAGAASPVFDRSGFSFGINICNDANYPACAMTLSQQGAQLLCYPLNNMLSPSTAEKWRSKSVDNLRQRAMENGCWVASSDVVGTHENKISHGCTCIIAPDGSMVARVNEGEAGVIVFDIPILAFK